MRSFLLLIAAAVAIPSSAQAVERQLVKTTQRWRMIGAEPPANWISANCHAISFTPATRSVEFAGSEPPHTENAFVTPFCPWELGAYSNYTMIVADVSAHSLHDIGTYHVICEDISVSALGPPCSEIDGICGRTTICAAHSTAYHADRYFDFEIYNDPATLNLTIGGAAPISGADYAYNAGLSLAASASDPDGGSVRQSWRVAGPTGATALVGGLSGATLDIQFIDERDFGTWTIEAIADDNEGERTRRTQTVRVVNRTPAPSFAAGMRVRVNTTIELDAGSDEDGGEYTAVNWEAIPPGETAWRTVGNMRRLSLPATAAELGFWSFRVTVTDNDSPALTGTSAPVELEVYNDPPSLTVTPPVSPVRAGVGSISLSATASDPDGGAVTIRWRAVQAPRSSGVAVGTPLSSTVVTGKGVAPFSMATTAAHAGTWVFVATAGDEEGGQSESAPQVVVVDARPVGAIRDAPAVVVGPGRFDLTDESRDPDSYCADAADPHRCHLVEAGRPFTPLSTGIRRWRWHVESVPDHLRLSYPTGPVNAAFHVPDALQVLHFEPGQIPAGTYRFRVDVEDGEANPGSATITIEVLPPYTAPIANIGLPDRFLADSGRRLLEDVWVDGSWSFDLDTARTFSPGPGVGITSYSWTPLPPSGCSLFPAMASAPRSRLFTAGTVLPLSCFGAWRVRLTVVDDDIPAQAGFDEELVILGTCGGTGVCIDSPLPASPAEIRVGTTVDVPIVYYVDAAVYLRPEYRWGFYAFIDILPTGSTTPIKTLTDTTVSSRPGQLTTVRWRGDTTSGALAPTGTYDVRVRLADISLNPGPETRQNSVILFENATITVDATRSVRFARHQDIDAGTATADFYYRITNSFGVDQVRSTITRVGGALAHEVSSMTTALEGEIHWNGRNSAGTVLAPGDYDLVVSAYFEGRLIRRSSAYRFTIYRLGLGPLPPSPSILSVTQNFDDDNANGTADSMETNVSGENDLAFLAVRVEPSTLAGVMTLSLPGGGAPIALFSTATKSAAHSLPLTRNRPTQTIPGIHVEGRTIGVHQLELAFTPTGRPALRAERLRINVMGIETIGDTDGHLGLDPSDTITAAVVPGLWQDAHTAPVGPTSAFNVLIDAPPNNFVDRDPAHFWVRVYDFAANRDPAAIETIQVQIGTMAQFPVPPGAVETSVDDPHDVPAIETGPDTGVFVTLSQLITTNDEDHVEGDDEQMTPDLAGAVTLDDFPGDRTHRVGTRAHGFLAGGVRATYSGNGRFLRSNTPVCNRFPDVRRSILLRFSAMREPFQDGGYTNSSGIFVPGNPGVFDFENLNSSTDVGGVAVHDPEEPSEPYMDISTGSGMFLAGGPGSIAMRRDGRGAGVNPLVINDQLHRANGAWAPACIEMRRENELYVFDSPRDGAGIDVLADGILDRDVNIDLNEFETVFGAVDAMPGFGPVSQTRFDIVYGSHNIIVTGPSTVQTAYGVALVPFRYPDHAGKVLAIINGFVPNNIRVLAHELGHALTNLPDSDNLPWNFFPANTTFTDDTYYFRRFLPVIGAVVHTDRPVLDMDEIGNTHRRAY